MAVLTPSTLLNTSNRPSMVSVDSLLSAASGCAGRGKGMVEMLAGVFYIVAFIYLVAEYKILAELTGPVSLSHVVYFVL